MSTKIALKQLRELNKRASKIRLAAEKWDEKWKTLIVTILSARTRDEKTIPIAIKLFSKYNKLEKLAKAKLKDVKKVIKQINFYKNKSKNIIKCSKMLVKKYKGKIPTDFNRLIELPGVGRKTANVFLSEQGYDAIGIDTHCAYISRKLGWTKNMKPEIIEDDLKKLFPKNYWKKVNPILVRFGKTYTSRKEKDKLLENIKQKFK